MFLLSKLNRMFEIDSLNKLDWIPVPDHPYVMKYNFPKDGDGYIVVLSNLASVYEEKMATADIDTRFHSINSFVRMRLPVILDRLEQALFECLHGDKGITLKVEENKITVQLAFSVKSAVCQYDIKMSLMPADKVMHYIIEPTVLGAALSRRKVFDLQSRLLSVEKTKSPELASTASTVTPINPDWLNGKNVPAQFILDSFLGLQDHFRDLSSENNDAYKASLIKETENTSALLQPKRPRTGQAVEFTDEAKEEGFKLITNPHPRRPANLKQVETFKGERNQKPWKMTNIKKF